jgi:DNA polymerase kappa
MEGASDWHADGLEGAAEPPPGGRQSVAAAAAAGDAAAAAAAPPPLLASLSPHHGVTTGGAQHNPAAVSPPGRASSASSASPDAAASPQAQQHQQQAQPSPRREAWQDYSSVFTNAKAGMAGVDKEHVKKVVYEMSKVRLTGRCPLDACSYSSPVRFKLPNLSSSTFPPTPPSTIAAQDSAHFKNEQRKQRATDEKIAAMRAAAARLGAGELAARLRALDAKIAALEAGRDLTRSWLHVDMDVSVCGVEGRRQTEVVRCSLLLWCEPYLNHRGSTTRQAFYAAVKERDSPALRGVPMAVGGMGMITTANYQVGGTVVVQYPCPRFSVAPLASATPAQPIPTQPNPTRHQARPYGVRSAMPGFIALRLCPQLVFVAPDFEKYRAASEETRTVFRRYDPDFRAGSLDEVRRWLGWGGEGVGAGGGGVKPLGA